MKFGELSSMYGNVCSRPKYTRLVKRPTPTINTGKPSKMYRPARTAVENWTHSHKTRALLSQRFTAEYSSNLKDVTFTHHYHVLYYSTGGYCVFFY